jgi:hypothetical protein
MTDPADLIEQAKDASAWLADQAEINWDGNEVDTQRAEIVSAVEQLAAALASEKEHYDSAIAAMHAQVQAHDRHGRTFERRAEAAESREAALREALGEADDFLASLGYEAQNDDCRIAIREALARTAGETP